MSTKNVFLITGRPGCGKTTLIRRTISALKLDAGGFYTEEIRDGGGRQGFRIVTLDGEVGVLASISCRSKYRVSKYGVDIDSLDTIAVAALRRAIAEKDVIVVDEIGKMELYSSNFKRAVIDAIQSGKPILGTIMLASHPWADNVKRYPNVQMANMTQENRSEIQQRVIDWVIKFLNL